MTSLRNDHTTSHNHYTIDQSQYIATQRPHNSPLIAILQFYMPPYQNTRSPHYTASLHNHITIHHTNIHHTTTTHCHIPYTTSPLQTTTTPHHHATTTHITIQQPPHNHTTLPHNYYTHHYTTTTIPPHHQPQPQRVMFKYIQQLISL